ncbi:MAG: hypothetical protein IT353_24720 [Gemmatimonadaceae bacterium]|nr:hypothetical protein [Gemmatimonadaceae bacterium]
MADDTVLFRASDRLLRARIVSWTTSDPSVVSVDSRGRVHGRASGEAIVTAAGGSIRESARVAVVTPTSVSVSATKMSFAIGEAVTLSASVRASDGELVTPRRVQWSVASGASVALASSGMAVGQVQGLSEIRAVVAGGVTGTLALTVSPLGIDPSVPIARTFDLTPAQVTIESGSSLQFAAAATWLDGATRSTSVVYIANGGTIDVNGLYKAGAVAGTFSVIATCACGRSDTAQVTIRPVSSTATLSSLGITPRSATLNVGQSQQFAVQPVWSDGAIRAAQVTYSASAGTVTGAGLYTAPSTPGTYRVIAQHVGGVRADTAAVVVISPPTGGAPVFVQPTPPVVYNPPYPALTGVSRRVAAGGNLQAALNAAQPGDEVVLANGAVFTGNFTLPTKTGAGWITLRAENLTVSPGVRVSPATMSSAPRIVTPNASAAIQTAPGAKRWRLTGIEVTQATGLSINYGLVLLGVGLENSRAALPSNIVLDRMYIHGTATDNLKRCVAFNGDSLAVVDSWLAECHGKGFDAQGIGGWNGGGPFLIENNHIEGSGQAIMFGGADPSIANLSPSDIVIRRNHLFKPLSWGGGRWSIKATFELKHARRVLFVGNILENHWADAQVGFAILFQAVSDNNTAHAWTTIEDVLVQNNRVLNSTSGANLLSRLSAFPGAPLPYQPASRIAFVNNLFEQVGRDPISGAAGRMTQFLGDLHDITLLNNTFYADGEPNLAVSLDGGAAPQQRFGLFNNVFSRTVYGLFGSSVGAGQAAIDRFATGGRVAGNVFTGATSLASRYPASNHFPASNVSVGFVSTAGDDFSLLVGGAHASGIFGRIGVDMAALRTATNGVK